MATVSDAIDKADREGQLKVSRTDGVIEKALDRCLRVAREVKSEGSKEFVNVLFIGDGGSGKEMPDDTPIQTPGGTKNIGDMKVGDLVIGTDGKPHKVTGVFPQGTKEVVKFILSDGSEVLSGWEHLWTFIVRSHRQDKEVTMTTKEALAKFGNKITRNVVALPSIKPIEYSHKDFSCDPYVLGVFLSDGCCKHGDKIDWKLTLSSGDEFIPNWVGGILGLTPQKRESNYSWYFKKSDGSLAKQSEYLPSELCGRGSYDKYIPEEYFYGDPEQRLALLRGLMDTDGSAHPSRRSQNKGGNSFSSVSKALAEGVIRLVRSLGGFAHIREVHRVKSYKGVSREKTSYQVRFNCEFNPFLLPRKAELHKIPHQFMRRKLREIVEIKSSVPCTCIEVDSPDHLFLANDFIPTHNTSRIKSWAKANGINLKEVHTADLDQTDMGGAVAPDKTGTKVTRLSPTEMNSLAEPNSVLFLDEYNRGMDQIRGTLLTLIENHTVYDAEAPGFRRELEGMLFTVAAINPFSADFNVQQLDAAEESRFMTVWVDSDPLATLNWYRTKEFSQPQNKGRLAIGEALLSSPKFSFTSGRDLERVMESGNRKPLSARTLTRLLRACDGTKEDFLDLWGSFCDDSKKAMAEMILANYQDVDDKANRLLHERETESPVFQKRETLVDRLKNLVP